MRSWSMLCVGMALGIAGCSGPTPTPAGEGSAPEVGAAGGERVAGGSGPGDGSGPVIGLVFGRAAPPGLLEGLRDGLAAQGARPWRPAAVRLEGEAGGDAFDPAGSGASLPIAELPRLGPVAALVALGDPAERPDALVVLPSADEEALVPLLEAARDAGVPVLTLLRPVITAPLAGHVLSHVGLAPGEGARSAAAELCRAARDGEVLVELSGPAPAAGDLEALPAPLRPALAGPGPAFEAAVASICPAVRVLRVAAGEASDASAEVTLRAALERAGEPEAVAAVLVLEPALAAGARRVLDAAGQEGAPILLLEQGVAIAPGGQAGADDAPGAAVDGVIRAAGYETGVLGVALAVEHLDGIPVPGFEAAPPELDLP